MSLAEACAELERCAGSQFDPEIVRLFTEQVRENPPTGEREHALAAALADPEIEARRNGPEPILGHGSFAVTDNLTLLYTHRYFHEVAKAEAERAALQDRSFAVVLVEVADIDVINREEGYAAGDRPCVRSRTPSSGRRCAVAERRAATKAGAWACWFRAGTTRRRSACRPRSRRT